MSEYFDKTVKIMIYYIKIGGDEMIERMELGEFYKELRLARKLKQSDVACAGLTASQLSKFELGQSSCLRISSY